MIEGLPAIAVNPDHSERVVELVAYGDVYQEVSGEEDDTESSRHPYSVWLVTLGQLHPVELPR